MENSSPDQAESSATEPTSNASAPLSRKQRLVTWQLENRELMFLLGLGLGLLFILIAQALSVLTNGEFLGCIVPFVVLPFAVPILAFKSQRFLGVGLLVGLLIAIPVSAALWINLVCGPGPGCG